MKGLRWRSWRRRSPPARSDWPRRRRRGCGWSLSSTHAAAGTVWASTRARTGWPGSAGWGPAAAREHVRVARALPGLPRIEAAFAAGRLSYSKVRALTRIAAPDCEAALVEFALSATASQTERFCREWRLVDHFYGRRRERSLGDQLFEHWYDDDGFLTLKIRMPADRRRGTPDERDRLRGRAGRPPRTRPGGEGPSPAIPRSATPAAPWTTTSPERCADDAAVGIVGERTAARRIAALTTLWGPASGRDRRPGDPPRREVVVHADAAVLADDTAAGRAYSRAARRSRVRRCAGCCARPRVAMIEHGREPLALGRRRRRATGPAPGAAAARRGMRAARLPRDPHRAPPRPPHVALDLRRTHRPGRYGAALRRRPRPRARARPGRQPPRRKTCRHRRRRPPGVGRRRRRVRHRAARLAAHPPRSGERTRTPASTRSTPPSAAAPPMPGDQPRSTTVPRTGRPRAPVRADRCLADRHPRPATAADAGVRRRAGRPAPGTTGARADTAAAAVPPAQRAGGTAARLSRVLFPDGEPTLAESLQEGYDRLDLRFALGVLLDNRDLARRLAAEAGVPVSG